MNINLFPNAECERFRGFDDLRKYIGEIHSSKEYTPLVVDILRAFAPNASLCLGSVRMVYVSMSDDAPQEHGLYTDVLDLWLKKIIEHYEMLEKEMKDSKDLSNAF